MKSRKSNLQKKSLQKLSLVELTTKELRTIEGGNIFRDALDWLGWGEQRWTR
jgi:bacteriocin-like protein